MSNITRIKNTNTYAKYPKNDYYILSIKFIYTYCNKYVYRHTTSREQKVYMYVQLYLLNIIACLCASIRSSYA